MMVDACLSQGVLCAPARMDCGHGDGLDNQRARLRAHVASDLRRGSGKLVLTETCTMTRMAFLSFVEACRDLHTASPSYATGLHACHGMSNLGGS